MPQYLHESEFEQQPSAPATPASGNRKLYPKATGWFDLNDSGDEVLVGPGVFGAAVTKTIASGVVAAGDDRHLIIAAESATSDDLDEIIGLSVGDAVYLRADSGDTITVKHNAAAATVKILLYGDADVTLDEDNPLVLVLTSSTSLVQLLDENSGGVDGTTGSTDNAVIRADGTGGGTVQASGVTIDDSDNVDVPGDMQVDGALDVDGVMNVNGGALNFYPATPGGNPQMFYYDDPATKDGWGEFFDDFATKDLQFGEMDNGSFVRGTMFLTTAATIDLPTSLGSNPSSNGYVRHFNVGGEGRVMDSAGNVTTLSPHPTETMVDTSGRPTTHVHKESNLFSGRVVEMDTYGALKSLEALTGDTFVYEDTVPLGERQNKMLSRYDNMRRDWRGRKG